MQLAGFEAPPLFKFCPSKYDISNGCNTIRIGTLWGFREEENELLRDKGEGEFEFRIQFPKLTPVSNEWISEIGMDASGSAYIEEMQSDGGAISIKGATLKGSSHNCWIFCVSMGGDAVGNVSEAHESQWTIPGDKVQEFGNFLATSIWKNVSIDDLDPNFSKNHSLQEINAGLALQMEMRPVIYDVRDAHIQSEIDFPVDKVRELKSSIPFLKPKTFSLEKEFRFAFWLSFNNQRISVNNKPKILQLREIDQLIRRK